MEDKIVVKLTENISIEAISDRDLTDFELQEVITDGVFPKGWITHIVMRYKVLDSEVIIKEKTTNISLTAEELIRFKMKIEESKNGKVKLCNV